MNALWLVQRLDLATRNRKGFDGIFSCQYMGSAEFEFGALPQSLSRIRAGKDVGLSTVEVSGRTVHLYGARKQRELVAEALPEWVENGAQGKEWSYFPEHLYAAANKWQGVDAWWAVREDVLFTLDADTAALFEEAVTR